MGKKNTNYKSSAICRLYKCAYREFEWQISECEESFHITDGQYSAVKHVLKEMFSEREYKIILLRFGLEDGRVWNHSAIANRLDLPYDTVCKINAKAIRKLVAKKTMLPRLFCSKKGDDVVRNIIYQLNILHDDPIFKREAELKFELRELSHSPFTYANHATVYLVGRNETDIDKLDFSVHTYNCLRRAGITTFSDIVDYPKEEWPKIKEASPKVLREIERKMRAQGFTDFKILD